MEAKTIITLTIAGELPAFENFDGKEFLKKTLKALKNREIIIQQVHGTNIIDKAGTLKVITGKITKIDLIC